MTTYQYKQPKPVICVCGNKFRKKQIERYHPYCSIKCKLKHVTGKGKPHIKMPLQTLKDMAKGVFCDYIKLRDKDLPEITSGQMEKKGEVMNGGHLFSCERVPGLMFEENNCFKQSEFFNFQMQDVVIFSQTSDNVRRRIGLTNFQILIDNAQSSFMRNYKWSALEYIEQWEKFTNKIQQLKNKG